MTGSYCGDLWKFVARPVSALLGRSPKGLGKEAISAYSSPFSLTTTRLDQAQSRTFKQCPQP